MWASGQIIRAADMLRVTPRYIELPSAHEIDSTTLADTAIVVPVDGPTGIRLRTRWESGGAGIRWAWRIVGSVTGYRMWHGPGTEAGGGITNVTTIQMRTTTSLTSDSSEIAHISAASTYGFVEDLQVDGDGSLVLQVAQQASHASSSTLHSAGTWCAYVSTLLHN